MSDRDVCVFCSAAGCVDGTAQHGLACPFTTGMWPVDEEEVRRGSECCACLEPFALGDLSAQVTDMSHPAIAGALDVAEAFGGDESSITFTVCLPCAALGREIA